MQADSDWRAGRMPTAAKLVAAVALAFVTAMMVPILISYYPDERFDRDARELMQTFAIIGGLVGWFSLGKRVKTEGGKGIMLGLRAALVTTIWIVFVLAVNNVVGSILDRDLAGAEPMEAIFQMFAKAAEYGTFLLNPKLVGIIAFAGVTVGVLTANTQRKWN